MQRTYNGIDLSLTRFPATWQIVEVKSGGIKGRCCRKSFPHQTQVWHSVAAVIDEAIIAVTDGTCTCTGLPPVSTVKLSKAERATLPH